MKVVGIIAEYNPFHNGHAYHIQKAKEITGAEFALVIMSGNFVQRGAPAFIDKYTRTRMALENGADLVFELPVAFATASAELFAQASIEFLHATGVVSSVCFGSETEDLSFLTKTASILYTEPDIYRQYLCSFLKEGNSYPRAVSRALCAYFTEMEGVPTASSLSDTLFSPNTILGVEYLKSLLRLRSPIKPYCIARSDFGYHSQTKTGSFCSASALRHALLHGEKLSDLADFLPDSCLTQLQVKKSLFLAEDDLSLLLDSLLLIQKDQLPSIADMTPELVNRIHNILLTPRTFSGWCEALKTKNITYAHISRALLHLILQIHKDDMQAYKETGLVPYARLLGFRKNASCILSAMKKTSAIPVITKVADASALLSKPAFSCLQKDLFAADIYRRLVFQKSKTILPDEYRNGVVILP